MINTKSTVESRLAPNFEFAPIFLEMYPSATSHPIEKRNIAYTADAISWLNDQIKCGRANRRRMVIALGINSLRFDPVLLEETFFCLIDFVI